jgi:hypothetical protein
MPRVRHVKKARKSHGKCGSCGTPINVGDPYKWAKPRYGSKKVRCVNCKFKRGDLSSSKMVTIYDAQDTAYEGIKGWGGEEIDELKSVLEDFSEVVREVASEYEESAENIRQYFPESWKADELDEAYSELEGWAEEIDCFDPDEFDPEAGEDKESWAEERRSEAEELVGNCPR